MSSAGYIFREHVLKVNETGAGRKVLTFDVENDGFLLSAERVSGNGTASIKIISELPDTMTEIELELFRINSSMPYTTAHVSNRRVKLEITWEGVVEIRFAIKLASGAALTLWKAEQETSADKDTLKWRTEQLAILNNICSTLDKILNHQRYITGLEKDKGDSY